MHHSRPDLVAARQLVRDRLQKRITIVNVERPRSGEHGVKLGVAQAEWRHRAPLTAWACRRRASSLFFPVNRDDIESAAATRLPAIHHWPEAAEGGGFLAYGPRFTQVWRQRARLTIKILRGNNPADLPVEQPTNFELVINLQTAKTIGHEVPSGLVLRADEVIE
jgi:hypothetical protein